jgi:hypothetical protein
MTLDGKSKAAWDIHIVSFEKSKNSSEFMFRLNSFCEYSLHSTLNFKPNHAHVKFRIWVPCSNLILMPRRTSLGIIEIKIALYHSLAFAINFVQS